MDSRKNTQNQRGDVKKANIVIERNTRQEAMENHDCSHLGRDIGKET